MKILIIEDEIELANSIGQYLYEMGYRCEFAPSVEKAIKKNNSCNYDCILLDFMLPDGEYFKILEILKA